MGIDLFLEKPSNAKEITFFADCIEALLGKKHEEGFRGVQSKSMVDLIQLECLSQTSSLLKITNGAREGKIWIQNGEVIDAGTEDLSGEEAFKKILSWKTGNFEILPPEPDHARRIFNSYQGLLLETAQALDEAQGVKDGSPDAPAAPNTGPMAGLSQIPGLQFVVAMRPQAKEPEEWAVENPEQLVGWLQETLQRCRHLGEKLHAGGLRHVVGSGFQEHIAFGGMEGVAICASFKSSLKHEEVQDNFKKVTNKWAS